MGEHEGDIHCETCESTIPSDSPLGMCPRCLLDPDLLSLVEESPVGEDEILADTFSTPFRKPESIGPYRIDSLIAEGGMGRIYSARQRHPIERRVALKVIKPGMGSGEVVARFEGERQTLAMMNHPYVASVFDAGTNEDGLPYFAMEFVDGVSLTEFCASERLSIEERLRLFERICDAIQHAHQKGIIHRDLKPSNILVTRDEDGIPSPKVIDFGIAKALSADPSDPSAFTIQGHLVGTPQYMSPEQSLLEGGSVDTRSDIYSLGVLLYELLIGRTPLGRKEDGSGESSLSTWQRLRSEEAPPAFRRYQNLSGSEQERIAAERGLTPPKLTSFLAKDLNCILVKALEKDPAHRYESASNFRRDVERYLNGEPVLACHATARYRLGKFAKKNKALIVGSGAVAVSLIIGIITTSWQAKVARDEERKAIAAKENAEDLVEFMLSDLRGRLSRLGKLEVMAGVEDAVRNYYDRSGSGEIGRESDSRRALALTMAAQTLERQGRLEEALEATQEALSIRHSLLFLYPDQDEVLEELAESLLRESWLLEQLGDTEGCDRALLTLEKLHRQYESESTTCGAKLAFAEAMRRRSSDLLVRSGDRETAEKLAREALHLALKAKEQSPDSDDAKRTVALAISTADTIGADVTELWDRFANPGTFYDIMGEILSSSPDDFTQKADLLEILAQPNYDRLDQERLELGLDLAKELTTHDPSNIEWQTLAASMEARTAYVYLEAYQKAASVPYFQNADRLFSSIIGSSEASERVKRSHVELLSRMAATLQATDDEEGAILCQSRALETLREMIKESPGDADIMYLLSTSLFRLSRLGDLPAETQLPLLEEAFHTAEQAYSQMDKTGQSDGAVYYSCIGLVEALLETKELESATRYADRALFVAKRISPLHEIGALDCNAKLALASGDLTRASSLYRRSAEIWKTQLEDSTPKLERGTFGRRFAHVLSNMLSCTNEPDAEILHFTLDSLRLIRDEVVQLDPAVDSFSASVRDTASLSDQLAELAASAGLTEFIPVCVETLVAVSLYGAQQVAVDSDKKFKNLERFTTALNKWEARAPSYNFATWISEDSADLILTTWQEDPLAMQRLSYPTHDIDRLPWLACQSRIRKAIKRNDPMTAAEWSSRARILLEDRWRELGEAEVTSPMIVLSLLDLLELQKSFAPKKTSEIRTRCFELGIEMAGRQDVIRRGGEETFLFAMARLIKLGDVPVHPERGRLVARAHEFLESWPQSVLSRFSSEGRLQAALIWERAGTQAIGRKDWAEAEQRLHSALKFGAHGSLAPLRAKALLVIARHESGKKLDENYLQMQREVLSEFEVLERDGALSSYLQELAIRFRKSLVPTHGQVVHSAP